MIVEPLGPAGVLKLTPKRFADDRGWFSEAWHETRYRDAGIAEEFVQMNLSQSKRNVLRGLHYQDPNPQGKLVMCLQGHVWDVAVDIRPGSEWYGQWWAADLSAENGVQLYVPPGFAHGFVVRSEEALFAYLVTAHYDPAGDRSLLWSDPRLAIDWAVENPLVSAKDAAAPTLPVR